MGSRESFLSFFPKCLNMNCLTIGLINCNTGVSACQQSFFDGCISVLGRSGDRIERRKRWSKRQTKEGEEDE
jgi:hypothetical protein